MNHEMIKYVVMDRCLCFMVSQNFWMGLMIRGTLMILIIYWIRRSRRKERARTSGIKSSYWIEENNMDINPRCYECSELETYLILRISTCFFP